MSERVFKKGDPVECDDYGIGCVIKVLKSKNFTYPVTVEFMSDNSRLDYTIDGRSYIDFDITLRHKEHDWRP